MVQIGLHSLSVIATAKIGSSGLDTVDYAVTFVQDSHLMSRSEDGPSQKLDLYLLTQHGELGISMHFSILRDCTNTSTLSSTHR